MGLACARKRERAAIPSRQQRAITRVTARPVGDIQAVHHFTTIHPGRGHQPKNHPQRCADNNTAHTCPTAVPTRMFLEVMPYWVSVMPSAVTGDGKMKVFCSTMGTLDSKDENSTFHSGCIGVSPSPQGRQKNKTVDVHRIKGRGKLRAPHSTQRYASKLCGKLRASQSTSRYASKCTRVRSQRTKNSGGGCVCPRADISKAERVSIVDS